MSASASTGRLLRCGIAMAALASMLLPVPAATAQEKVLRAVLHADVRVLDPHWTTATIAGIHGMLVCDTLFGNDRNLQPQPRMIGKFDISADRLTYYFHAARRLEVP
jgi:peptide/nickel transport system substrate-binding protein